MALQFLLAPVALVALPVAAVVGTAVTIAASPFALVAMGGYFAGRQVKYVIDAGRELPKINTELRQKCKEYLDARHIYDDKNREISKRTPGWGKIISDYEKKKNEIEDLENNISYNHDMACERFEEMSELVKRRPEVVREFREWRAKFLSLRGLDDSGRQAPDREECGPEPCLSAVADADGRVQPLAQRDQQEGQLLRNKDSEGKKRLKVKRKTGREEGPKSEASANRRSRGRSRVESLVSALGLSGKAIFRSGDSGRCSSVVSKDDDRVQPQAQERQLKERLLQSTDCEGPKKLKLKRETRPGEGPESEAPATRKSRRRTRLGSIVSTVRRSWRGDGAPIDSREGRPDESEHGSQAGDGESGIKWGDLSLEQRIAYNRYLSLSDDLDTINMQIKYLGLRGEGHEIFYKEGVAALPKRKKELAVMESLRESATQEINEQAVVQASLFNVVKEKHSEMYGLVKDANAVRKRALGGRGVRRRLLKAFMGWKYPDAKADEGVRQAILASKGYLAEHARRHEGAGSHGASGLTAPENAEPVSA